MLTGIHFLLTYACNFECDHCFVYGGPRAKGTFTVGQIRDVLAQAAGLGTVRQVCFEGGEPALYYVTMREGIRLARERGFEAGVVTNAYWAISDEDAELWLRPLVEAGLGRLTVSDDELHDKLHDKLHDEPLDELHDELHDKPHDEPDREEGPDTPPKRALAAAGRLGVEGGAISTGRPRIEPGADGGGPVLCGGVMFRGRAVEKLADGLPRRRPDELTKCPHEDLRDPKRVHVDAYGNVHLCQGLCMGNMWETPLRTLAREYDAEAHPVSGPLARGGPLELATEYALTLEDGYVDECHLCYVLRRALVERFPRYLAPPQVYGM